MEHTAKTDPSLRENATRTAQQAVENVQDTAEDLTQSAKAAAVDRADNAKSTAANEVDGVASALRKAADELRDDSPQSRTFRQLSNGLADFSDTIRDKDFSELARDVSDFARRNPVVFLSGSVLLGLVASRFGKATDHGTSVSSNSYAAGNTPAVRPATAPQPVTAPYTHPRTPVAGGLNDG